MSPKQVHERVKSVNSVSFRAFSSGSRDYYTILGGSKSDTTESLKKKYRKLAKLYHPDSNPDQKSHEKFQELNEAWEVLKDDKERKNYDQLGHTQYKKLKEAGMSTDQQGFSGHAQGFGGFEDIFASMFGGQPGGRRQSHHNSRSPQRGSDIQLEMDVSFFDAIRGAKKSFSYGREGKCGECKGSGIEKNEKPKVETCSLCHGSGTVRNVVNNMMIYQETCPRCHGEGQKVLNNCSTCHGSGCTHETVEVNELNVPPGVDSGAILTRANGGNYGRFGGPPGDLLVFLRVSNVDPTKNFKRNRLDLHTEVYVSLVKSILGTSVDLQNAYEKHLELNINPGTKHKTTLRLSGEGIKYGQQKGDLYVKVLVDDVKDLTTRQIELLKEFEEEEKKKRNGLNIEAEHSH